MKSVACWWSVVALVLGFCCSFCESTLSQGPKDTSVLTGEAVKLECFTTNKNYPPLWSYQKVGSGEKKTISVVYKEGDRILIKLLNGYDQRHRIVENRDTGEYSLQITDAKPEDAGSYTCQARGGLQGSEIRSAELSVFEPFPACASNLTDAVGENDCKKEPDVIELSCKFQLYGNYLPKVTWIDANHPEKVIIVDTPTTDATGMTSSKLIIYGNYPGLDETSFKCIVASTENAGNKRFTCDTPKINVLKISNLTESRSLVVPEEVECTEWSKLNASGCAWYRGDDHKQDVLVSSKPLLNLHKADMTAGTYSCFAECNIRGETCRVILLKVSYDPPGTVTGKSESGQSNIIAVVVPVLIVLVGAVSAFFIWKTHKGTKCCTKRSAAAGTSTERYNGHSNQQYTPPSRESVSLMEEKAEANGKANKTPNHSSVDIPDAKFGGLTKSERNRLAEENATARMRANAAKPQKSETSQASSPETDVAEGVAGSEKTPLLKQE